MLQGAAKYTKLHSSNHFVEVALTGEEMKTAIEMAREAGNDDLFNSMQIDFLERFAELVRADERARMAEQPAQQEPVANASTWFALVMNAAAELEDASHCLRDEDAKSVAIRGAKYYRDAANALYTRPQAREPEQRELCPSCRSGSIYACTCTTKPAQQEPAAWMHPDGRIWTFGRGFDKATFTVPLYTRPQAREPEQPTIPQGWKLVPVKPTPEQIKSGNKVTWPMPCKQVYTAMLNAALQPAQQEPCGGCGGSGWVTRDPDIGTDQECFVCDGKGTVEPEQPAQQEPVAYAVYHRMGGGKSLHWPEQHSPDGDANEYQLVPLYTSPQAQRTWVGLTDEQIDALPLPPSGTATVRDLVRIIEAAHGITGEQS